MMVVYSKDNCPFCVKAKQLLESKGMQYMENKIGRDIQPDEFFEMFPNVRTVPHIIQQREVGGNHPIGGYDKLVEFFEYHDALKKGLSL